MFKIIYIYIYIIFIYYLHKYICKYIITINMRIPYNYSSNSDINLSQKLSCLNPG